MRPEFQALVDKEEIRHSRDIGSPINEFDEERFHEFLQALKQNDSLKSLTLAFAGLDDTRLKKICTVLSEKESLTHFDVGGNHRITSLGMKAVKSLLKKNKSIGLKTYNLGQVRGDVRSIRGTLAVRENTSREDIKLSSCGINDNDLEELLESLRDHDVKYIDLSCNKITSNGLRLLVEFLNSKPSVVDINLESNLIYSKFGNDFDGLIELVRKRLKAENNGEGERLIVRLGYNYLSYTALTYIDEHCWQEGNTINEFFSGLTKLKLDMELHDRRRSNPALTVYSCFASKEGTAMDDFGIIGTRRSPLDINYSMPNAKVNFSYSNFIDGRHKTISKEKWLVFLARKGGANHAMIFIQGVREFDQCFIDKFHFVSNAAGDSCTIFTSVGEAKIHKDLDPARLLQSFRDYKFKCQEITREEGLALKENILEQKNNPPTFEITGTVGNNCLTWANSMFEKAGINFKFKDSAYRNIPVSAITDREVESEAGCTIS